MKSPFLLLCVFAMSLGALRGHTARDNAIVIGDFEGVGYGGWKVQGQAFAKGPSRESFASSSPAALEIENYRGKGVASSEIEGDTPTGTLTSPEFTIQRHYIAFLIGGGAYEHHTCLNLLINGKIVCSATGWNSDRLTPVSWDVRRFRGKRARVQLVDEAEGSWGHINVDQIIQTNAPERLPVVTQPLYQETHRPQFHFTARQWTEDRLNPGMRQEGWLNDLNGLIYYEGEYHLFAQRWNKCWIHAVSRDLVHWTELEPAFWEEKLDSGVQSGTCVIDYANSSGLSPDKATPPMIAFWSRNDNRSHCISYSLDKGRTWKNYAQNPVLEFPERDPKVFWHAPSQHWVMFLYGNDQYHIFTSTNLLQWKDEKHPVPNSFECPDMFEIPIDGDRINTKWALIRGNGKYSLGRFDGIQFHEETPQLDSDAGPNFYATQTWANTESGDGRRIQTAWMRGGQYPDMPFNQQITFPRELTLRSTPDGPRLFREPIGEIATLHRSESTWENRTLRPGETLPLDPLGDLFHIQLEASIPDGATLTFHIRGATLVLGPHTIANGTDPIPVSGPLKYVEILIDRTSIEAFANHGEVSTSRCFLPDESGLSVRADAGPITIQSLRLFRLNSIWESQP